MILMFISSYLLVTFSRLEPADNIVFLRFYNDTKMYFQDGPCISICTVIPVYIIEHCRKSALFEKFCVIKCILFYLSVEKVIN